MLGAGLFKRLRISKQIRDYDAVYILKAAFPYGPPIIERRLKKSGVPMIYDFDDAIQIHKPSGNHRFLDFLRSPKRTAEVVAMVDHVVVPNSFLADFARKNNSSVAIIPEAEDTERLTLRGPHSNDRKHIVIGWVGSASTAKYLTLIADALREICSKYPQVVLRVIGGGFESEGIRTEQVPWRFEKEVEQFHDLDIGVMPLPLEDWSKGKSGCKLRQYMATGVPGVATRIGYNCELVDDGQTGFLVETTDDWVHALSRLIESPVLRNTIAINARTDVERRFAVDVIGPKLKQELSLVVRTNAHLPK